MKRVALTAIALLAFGTDAFAQARIAGGTGVSRSAPQSPRGGRNQRPEPVGVMPTVPARPEAPAIDDKTLAELREINQRFQAAYGAMSESCGGIYDRVKTIQSLAGWNTGVSGLGTLAAGGALGTGIAKSVVDKKIEETENEIEKLIARIEAMDDREFFNFLGYLSWAAEMEKFNKMNADHAGMVDKSKNLGNWRTGLAAGSTATSIASTALASQNFNLDNLISKMEDCNKAITLMKGSEADMSAKVVEGDFFGVELGIAHKLLASCEPYDLSAIRAVEAQQKTVTVSSAIGIGTGAVATATSAIANLSGVRNDKSYGVNDKAATTGELFTVNNAERNAETAVMRKGLNIAANIASGATTLTSGVSTGFSIATLATVNSIVDQAERCDKAMK